MGFILGVLIGAGLGSLCTVAYSVRSDRDLRTMYTDARTTIAQQDLGARVAEAQANIGNRIGRARGQTTDAVEAAASSVSGMEADLTEAATPAAS
jgi:hypothetical protein